jgi:uncharacterized membrane protein YbhN (UPF0104 family)
VPALTREPAEVLARLTEPRAPAGPVRRLIAFGRRRRTALTVVGSLVTAAILVLLLAGRRDEFTAALSSAAVWVIAVTTLLQIVALVARSEAWHLTIEAAGGAVDRRILYRASSMQVLGGVINGHLGVAARIAALRRASPDDSPQVPTLIAAEFPILAVEATLAAFASFTLVGPLGLPWWLPIVILAVIGLASAGLRRLALERGRELWRGLAVLRGRLRARRGLRADLPQLAAVARRRRRRVDLRRHRRPDRLGDARTASGRPERRRGGSRAHPRQPRRRGSRRRRRAPDRHGHAWRPAVRRMGRRGRALVRGP